MSRKPIAKKPSLLAMHRQRQREQGLQRLEVQVRGADAALVRAVVAALADPHRAVETRALLMRIAPPRAGSLKDLLASAPLEGIDLTRSRDTGRSVEL